MSGIMYKNRPYAGGGGGTDVEANPTGTPTDELNTIRIGQDIYEIVGGGGGGGNFEITDLWKNTTGGGNGTYTLSQSIDDFDAISIWFGIYSEYVNNPYISDHRIINVLELQEAHNAGIRFILTGYASRVVYVDFNGTTMTLSSQSGSQTVLQIKGIKY